MVGVAQPMSAADAAALRDAPYAVALTSCGRFDLLAATVQSLLTHLDARPASFVVAEDSGDAAVHDVLRPYEALLGARFEILLNRPQLGQMRSIDRLYAAIDAPLVFHCEDDWAFFRSGFLDASRRLLAARPEVSMVGLRPRGELNPLVRGAPTRVLDEGRGAPIAHFDCDPSLHPEYFSYSFNPGLRRLADLRAFGATAEIGREEDVSYAFKRAGFRIANLEAPAVRHIGGGAHVDDPTSRPKPRGPFERLARSARKRWKRLARAASGG